MSADLKDLLDDAAATALGSRSLDARALLLQGRARHRRTLLNRGAAALAVAAALVLGLLLVPAGWVAPPPPARSTSGPVGLPRSLPLPTPWTPTITESPVERASMLLGLSDPGSDWGDDDVVLLLSADGTAYRRLPAVMAEADSTALTDDGRYVVAVSVPGKPGGRPDAVVHLLRLADGRVREVALPDSGQVSQVDRLVATPDSRSVYVVGIAGTEGEAGEGSTADATWVVDVATGRVSRSSLRPYLITRQGQVFAEPDAPRRRGLPTPLPSAYDSRGFGRTVPSPDGRQLATYTALVGVPVARISDGYGFVVGPPAGQPALIPFPAPDEREPSVVSWIPEGILVRWNHQLRLFDPARRSAALVAALEQPPERSGDRGPGTFSPYEVAYDVVSAGGRVRGVTQQDEPAWPVRVVRSPTGARGEAVAAALALGAAAAVLLLVRRRRRRGPADSSSAPVG